MYCLCVEPAVVWPIEVRAAESIFAFSGPVWEPWPLKEGCWTVFSAHVCSALRRPSHKQPPCLNADSHPECVCVRGPSLRLPKVDTYKGWLRLPEGGEGTTRACLAAERSAVSAWVGPHPGGDTLEGDEQGVEEATWSSGQGEGALGVAPPAAARPEPLNGLSGVTPPPRTLIRDLSRSRRCLKRFQASTRCRRCGCSLDWSTEYDHPGPICSQRPRSTLRDQILISHFLSAWETGKLPLSSVVNYEHLFSHL